MVSYPDEDPVFHNTGVFFIFTMELTTPVKAFYSLFFYQKCLGFDSLVHLIHFFPLICISIIWASFSALRTNINSHNSLYFLSGTKSCPAKQTGYKKRCPASNISLILLLFADSS